MWKQKFMAYTEKYGNRVKDHTLALRKQISITSRTSPVLYFLTKWHVFSSTQEDTRKQMKLLHFVAKIPKKKSRSTHLATQLKAG